jgi:hypothetical protein
MFTKEALEKHLMVPSSLICEPVTSAPRDDAEDGVSEQVEMRLNTRTSNGKVDNWKDLWSTLFPDDGDEEVPSPGKSDSCSEAGYAEPDCACD